MSNEKGVTLPQIGERVVNGSVGLQAQLLLEQGRVWVAPATQFALIFGRTGVYRVRFFTKGSACSCPAGKKVDEYCSHKTAALVAIQERGTVPVDFPIEVGEQVSLFGGAA